MTLFDVSQRGRAITRYYLIQKMIDSSFKICGEIEGLKSTKKVDKILENAILDGGKLHNASAEEMQSGISAILEVFSSAEGQSLLAETALQVRSQKLFVLKANMRLIAVQLLGEFIGDVVTVESQYNKVVETWLNREDVEYFLALRLQELKHELDHYEPGDQDSPEIYSQFLKTFLRADAH